MTGHASSRFDVKEPCASCICGCLRADSHCCQRKGTLRKWQTRMDAGRPVRTQPNTRPAMQAFLTNLLAVYYKWCLGPPILQFVLSSAQGRPGCAFSATGTGTTARHHPHSAAAAAPSRTTATKQHYVCTELWHRRARI